MDTAKMTLKLGDFGLSRSFSEMRQSDTSMTVVGTEEMMAPEIRQAYVKREPSALYTTKADIWPCGLLAYLAAKKKLPSKCSYTGNSLKIQKSSKNV